MGDITKDERFSHVMTDPRFRRVPLKQHKIKIDNRFQGMFKDKNFNLKYTMDKRGRPMNHTTSEDFRKFYEMSSGSEGDSSEEENEEKISQERVKKSVRKNKSSSKLKSSLGNEDDASHSNSEDTGNCSTGKLKDEDITAQTSALKDVAVDRDEIDEDEDITAQTSAFEEVDADSDESDETDTSDETDSSDETGTSDSDDEEDDQFDHKWQELDADAPRDSIRTRRLALCNMDWDRIGVDDILILCNSFKPQNGVINDVKIFPTEYGSNRLKDEQINGPAELVEKSENKEDGDNYHREKLRQYQINRLKYYYAVIDCDSVETASSLYDELDGMEYESSSVVMDLRFIADDMTFEQEPTSEKSQVENLAEYKPRLFVNSALQEIGVKTTWDETDPRRPEFFQRAFDDPEKIENDANYSNFFAPVSSSEDEETFDQLELDAGNGKLKMEDKIAQYKALLLPLEEKDKNKDEEEFDMEFTWEPGLKEKTELLVKDKLQKQNLTPFEEKLQKQKDERKLKKANRKKAMQRKDSDESMGEQDNDSNEVDEFCSKPRMTESERNAAELALLVSERSNAPTEESSLNNMSKKKNKKLMKMKKNVKDDSFVLDTQDERFAAIYTSPYFNIDPSDPNFKDSKGIQALIQEKQRRKRERENEFDSQNLPEEKQQKYMKMSNTKDLVESIKRKTANAFRKQK